MSELDTVIGEAVSKQDAPFLVAMTGNADGVTWSGAAGERSPGKPATVDTVFRIFSMTKAVGSTAAMILMDRGKLSPDATVESILPEFGSLKLLDGFGPDGPKLRAPRIKATIRHLATHTSGLVYEFWNADMPRYMEATGLPTVLSGLVASLNYPLQFEPGERWDYGPGIDWLGRVVEKVDGRRIDRFCREEIFDPLRMPDTRFEVEEHMASRLASVSMRGEDGKFADFALAPPSPPEF
jgi:methyl acetate hydrolase